MELLAEGFVLSVIYLGLLFLFLAVGCIFTDYILPTDGIELKGA